MATKKKQQTISKRNRERAVEEKRTLKRQAKQEKREAARNGELPEQADWLGPPNEQLGPDDQVERPAAKVESPPDGE
jgi:hypothetical protein